MAKRDDYIDRSGWKFGKITVGSFAGRNKFGQVLWNCLCDCGTKTVVSAVNLVSGSNKAIKSCGCYMPNKDNFKTHGATGTSEFNSWMYMNQRCSSTSDAHKIKYYGEVEVQESWKADFTEFLSHIGRQPNDGSKYTIERLDNSLGYCEGNVRWATQTSQARNKTLQKRSITGFNGVTLSVTNPRGWEKVSYVAVVRNLEGKRISKSFSVKKYGILPAFAMACKFRIGMISDLNAQGAGYSDKHGL
jgi:hypothetical protein